MKGKVSWSSVAFWHVSCIFSGVPLNLEIANPPPAPPTWPRDKATSSEFFQVQWPIYRESPYFPYYFFIFPSHFFIFLHIPSYFLHISSYSFIFCHISFIIPSYFLHISFLILHTSSYFWDLEKFQALPHIDSGT